MSSEEKAEIIPVSEVRRNAKPEFVRFRYTWNIEDFCLDTSYESPIFSPGGNGKLKWCLQLKTSLFGSLDIYICLLPCNLSEMTITYKISLINESGKTVITSLSPRTHQAVSSTDITEYKVMRDWSTSDMVEGMEELIPGRKFTILCEIEHTNEFEIPENIAPVIKVPKPQLLKDIEHLFDSHWLSDVSFKVGTRELPAHKAILSARSRVFSLMFETEMYDKGKPVDVTDVEPDVFEEMLRFVYTDLGPSVDKMADKLLMAAEKYQLDRLKLMCEETLRARLTVENAADTLILADLQHADQLKALTLEFITANTMAVVETAGFKSMANSHPYLTIDALRASIVKT